MTIRRAGRDDIDALVAIEASHAHGSLTAERFLHELGLSFSETWVLERDGRVVAFALLWRVERELEIHDIVTHASERRRGYGRALLSDILSSAKARGIERVLLEVRAGNTAAIGLYRALGFREDGRRRGYYRDNGEDALLMSWGPG